MPGQSFRGFAERVALVVGGARGVGRAVALQLALEGAYVIVSHAPKDEEGARVLNELREMGTLAHAVGGEASRAEGVEVIFRMVEESFGRLDMLVNAGGALSEAALADLTEDVWDEALAATLKSAYLCSRGAAQLMSKRPSASIVNVASEAGLTGAFGGVAGAAAHAGLFGLTKALARELGPRVRVNCVAVGESPPAPDEAARAVVYLLSPEAGAVTGQTLVVGAR